MQEELYTETLHTERRENRERKLMHMSMYDEFVFTLPKFEGPGGDMYASPKAYFNGTADMWHANMVMGFSVVLHEGLVDIPHVHHAVEEIYMFSGQDVAKFFDFDAEIEIWIGENPDRMEKYVITKPTLGWAVRKLLSCCSKPLPRSSASVAIHTWSASPPVTSPNRCWIRWAVSSRLT